MAQLLKGAPVAEALSARAAAITEKCKTAGISPTLAILRVGDKPDDVAYQRGAVKRLAAAGLFTHEVALSETVSQEELLREVHSLNQNEGVHGILLLRPLPKAMDETLIRGAIAPHKDVDGVTDASLAAVFTGQSTGFAPCTARACMELLAHYGVLVEGKRAVVLGRSLVVGRPLAMLLLAQNATVTLCHTKTQNLAEECQRAQLLFVSAGRAAMVNSAFLSPGQVVVDVGINVAKDGSLMGDVDAAAAEGIVGAYTPVPGGVGGVTTSVLALQTAEAASRQL